MREIIIAIILLFVALVCTYGAPGDKTTLPGTAFTSISGNGGKIRATGAKSAIQFRGSSVRIDPVTKTVIISGTGGGGATVHNNLSGRDAADSHPQSAITDLVTDMAAILAEFRNYTSGKKGIPGWRKPYDGRNAPPALSCFISDAGIAQAVIYNSQGLLPQPSSLLYTAYAFDGLTVLTENLSYDWYCPSVPGTTQLIPPAAEFEGMQTHRQTFEVGVMDTYSGHRTANYVRVQVTYSSPRWPWGKRRCSTRMPIPVMRNGA